ncbi:MAG: FkbM family methyltransferase [Prochloraceae cyanobacterium]
MEITSLIKEKGWLNKLQDLPISIGIIGSRKLGTQDDFHNSPWRIFPNLSIYGFDADPEACEQANSEAQNVEWFEHHFPLALSASKSSQEIYITEYLDCCSLYPPNNAFVDRLSLLNNALQLSTTVEIETTTLDNFVTEENVKIDFLFIDVQGAELDVIKGGNQMLENVLGLRLEVEFAPLYLGQPLFSDIDPYLRNHNFYLWDLDTNHNCSRRYRSISPIHSQKKLGQLIFADALYLRDPIQQQGLDPKQILKLACIADIFEYPDYCLELLYHLSVNFSDWNFSEEIKTFLARYFPEEDLPNIPIIQKLEQIK